MQRWTKRINIFEKDLVFIPINEDLHWSLAVIVNPGAELPKVSAVTLVTASVLIPCRSL